MRKSFRDFDNEDELSEELVDTDSAIVSKMRHIQLLDEEEEELVGPKDYYAMLNSCLLDQATDYPPPVSVLDIIQNGHTNTLLTEGSFSLLQGKQKSKKTTFLSMAIAAYIAPYSSNNKISFDGPADFGKVIYFDTEQGQSYGAKVQKRILGLAGLKESENLFYHNLREFSPSDRKEMIKTALKWHDGVKIVVIDGLVDMMDDFQNAQEAHELITLILRLCSKHDVHIIGVLHQNKADKNARSHVGSIASQKCEMEISLEIDGILTIVECRHSRGKPFETFAIRWDSDWKYPRIDQEYKIGENKENTKKEKFGINSLTIAEHGNIVKEIFRDDTKFNDGQLKEKIKLQLKKNKITEPIARAFVAHWHEMKLIEKIKGSRNSNIFRLSSLE